MSQDIREKFLSTIKHNVSKFGYHIYSILADSTPPYAYTIGMSNKVGAELILAGGLFYSSKEVREIINSIATTIDENTVLHEQLFNVDSLGEFSLREVDESWVDILMIGAIDFYKPRKILAWQIIPDKYHWTVDIPDLSRQRNTKVEPIWQYLGGNWPYTIAEKSVALTHLAVLRKTPITEAARWREERWEIYAGDGDNVPENELRLVPLGTLLAIDDSLSLAATINVGEAIWRTEEEPEWQLAYMP